MNAPAVLPARASNPPASRFQSPVGPKGFRRFAFAAIAGFACVTADAFAQLPILSAPTTDWVAIPYNGPNEADYRADQQTGQAESDIVGIAGHPAVYTRFQPANPPAGTTTGTMYFRIRVAAETGSAGCDTTVFVGVDA